MLRGIRQEVQAILRCQLLAGAAPHATLEKMDAMRLGMAHAYFNVLVFVVVLLMMVSQRVMLLELPGLVSSVFRWVLLFLLAACTLHFLVPSLLSTKTSDLWYVLIMTSCIVVAAAAPVEPDGLALKRGREMLISSLSSLLRDVHRVGYDLHLTSEKLHVLPAASKVRCPEKGYDLIMWKMLVFGKCTVSPPREESYLINETVILTVICRIPVVLASRRLWLVCCANLAYACCFLSLGSGLV
ncbi:unnamed protein product [Symbiodinium natans]|uniref:Uncharacterized protein n=1 Tax=Symbiodinium natans TaxID=878477 RepID=A0A812HS92_9DINO|nr:unnamed protein product [Symbiodinium natans]